MHAHHPIGVIAAQSIGEPGTQLSLTLSTVPACFADDTAQGLNRVEELFEVRTPQGQAYLSDINGMVNVWEEGDHYVLQITADSKENVELKLDGQKPTVAKWQEVSAGDVLATAKRGHNHILAPVAGMLKLTEKSIIITPLKESVFTIRDSWV